MGEASTIVSYILFVLSLSFLLFSLKVRRSMRNEIIKREEAIKLKEMEFNELRLLAASVTHEINNAMTIILGRAAQLLKKNENPAQEKIIVNIQTTSDRVVNSVRGLRQFIYPDTQESEEVIELPLLMDNVFKLAGQRIRNHGIELKLVGLEHKVIKGRKNQLEQLVINLLNQSIERLGDYPEKWVQIVAVDEDGKLNIYFMDSSGEVGDKISHKQYSEILEKNHGHLTVNQNNLIIELPRPDPVRYHY
jgi:C4-dicarboxylate-specific signal transduction histidine kinase